MIEQFSLSFVARAASRHYRVVLLVLVCALLTGAFYMHVARDQYEATMVIAPTASSLADDTPSLSGLGSGLVSSLVGGAGQMPRTFSQFANLISANFLASALLADDRIKEGVFPADWDENARKWRERSGPVQVLKTLAGARVTPHPTAQDLADYLDKYIVMTDVPRSDLYKVSYRHSDPQFAAYLLNRLYTVLDTALKERFVRRHAANISYINEVLAKTNSPDLRTVMTTLYMQEQRRMMLASSDLPFSADMVDRPTVSAKPVAPSAPVVFGAALFLGLILGVLAAILCERRPEIASLRIWGLGAVLFPQHNVR